VISCLEVVTSDEEAKLLNLWQLYMADLSEFREPSITVNGRYCDDRMRTYFAYDEHWAYQILHHGDLAGFALIRKSEPETYLIGEFFILSEFRKRGVGTAAVTEILRKFHGNWQIPFQNENPKAAKFWRQTIGKLGYSASESIQATDVLLSFTTCD
jgi:predicted acetyltransferase